jgi:hypothetical protein
LRTLLFQPGCQAESILRTNVTKSSTSPSRPKSSLKVSSDQLLGIETVKGNGRTHDNRLWRRFSQVEKLPPPKRKQIVQILDPFLGSEKVKKTG